MNKELKMTPSSSVYYLLREAAQTSWLLRTNNSKTICQEDTSSAVERTFNTAKIDHPAEHLKTKMVHMLRVSLARSRVSKSRDLVIEQIEHINHIEIITMKPNSSQNSQ